MRKFKRQRRDNAVIERGSRIVTASAREVFTNGVHVHPVKTDKDVNYPHGPLQPASHLWCDRVNVSTSDVRKGIAYQNKINF